MNKRAKLVIDLYNNTFLLKLKNFTVGVALHLLCLRNWMNKRKSDFFIILVFYMLMTNQSSSVENR